MKRETDFCMAEYAQIVKKHFGSLILRLVSQDDGGDDDTQLGHLHSSAFLLAPVHTRSCHAHIFPRESAVVKRDR